MRTIAEELQLSGLKSLLSICGMTLTTNSGQTVTATVDEAPELQDPVDNLKSKTPIYVRVQAASGAVTNPRAVKSFAESDGRVYTVKRYEEKHHAISESWICEAQRRSQ